MRLFATYPGSLMDTEPTPIRLRHRLEAAAVGALSRLLWALPARARYRLAGRLGEWARLLDRRHARHARDSLALRYGATGVEDKVRGVFRELGHLTGEIPLLEGLEPEGLRKRVVAVEGREHLDRIAADPRGTLVLTAHFGNWELLGQLLPGFGIRSLHGIYRRLDNPLLEKRLRAARQRHGVGAIPRERASRPVLAALRGGGTVAMLLDQNTRSTDRVRLPFLGEMARIPTAMARFAQRSNSPILPVFLVRVEPERFRLVALPPIEPGDYPETEEGVRDLTAAAVAAMEGGIALAPAQWFWVHRRWREEPRALVPGASLPPPWGGEVRP